MENRERILPEGMPSFADIRRTGALYVDKTDLVWKLAHRGKFNYLSRPRRFGKSMLVDTLPAILRGSENHLRD